MFLFITINYIIISTIFFKMLIWIMEFLKSHSIEYQELGYYQDNKTDLVKKIKKIDKPFGKINKRLNKNQKFDNTNTVNNIRKSRRLQSLEPEYCGI